MLQLSNACLLELWLLRPAGPEGLPKVQCARGLLELWQHIPDQRGPLLLLQRQHAQRAAKQNPSR